MSKTTIEETVEEFRKEYYGVKLGETQQFSDVNHRTIENFLRTALTTQKEEVVKEWRTALNEVLDALGGMYEQYCSDGHSFMSAGERASYILEKYEEYKFDGAGRITHVFVRENNNEEKKKGKFKKVTPLQD